jgi:hypothetical protein
VKLRNEPKKGRFGTPLENTKRTQELLAGKRRSKIRNEPKTSQLGTIGRFDIWTIFIRAVAAGGIRGSDVMGDIGEIPG